MGHIELGSLTSPEHVPFYRRFLCERALKQTLDGTSICYLGVGGSIIWVVEYRTLSKVPEWGNLGIVCQKTVEPEEPRRTARPPRSEGIWTVVACE